MTFSFQSPAWLLNVLSVISSLLIGNIWEDICMATSDECKNMPALHEVQVKVPALVSHACANIQLPEGFFSSLLCGKPRNHHAHIASKKNLIKVKKLSTQTLGNSLHFPSLYISIMNQTLIT